MREKAAARATEILRNYTAQSKFYEEIRQAAGARRLEDWYSQFTGMLARRFEAQGLLHPVRTWQR